MVVAAVSEQRWRAKHSDRKTGSLLIAAAFNIRKRQSGDCAHINLAMALLAAAAAGGEWLATTSDWSFHLAQWELCIPVCFQHKWLFRAQWSECDYSKFLANQQWRRNNRRTSVQLS